MVSILVFAGLTWQYIQKMETRSSGETIIVHRAAMDDLGYERSSALSRLNTIRENMGMNTLLQDSALEKAAQNHANYLIANHEKSHFEQKGKPHFTGVSPLDRALYTHYDALQVIEDLSTGHYSGKESIDGLLSAIYHRFGFLNTSIDEIGIGVAQDPAQSQNSAFVYDMGNSVLGDLCHAKSYHGSATYAYKVCPDPKHRIALKELNSAKVYYQKQNPKIIRYPYDGEREVPPAFYAESPDPLPDMEVSGFPISVTFNPYYFKQIHLKSFKLYLAETGEEVPTRYMDAQSDPHQHFTETQFALFPLERLAYNSRYRAELIYQVGKKKRTEAWSFQTVSITDELHIITKPQETIHLRSDRVSVLYFKPLDSHDMLQDIHYPHDLSLTFLDNHTIRIAFISDNKSDFVLRTEKRSIHVIVE